DDQASDPKAIDKTKDTAATKDAQAANDPQDKSQDPNQALSDKLDKLIDLLSNPPAPPSSSEPASSGGGGDCGGRSPAGGPAPGAQAQQEQSMMDALAMMSLLGADDPEALAKLLQAKLGPLLAQHPEMKTALLSSLGGSNFSTAGAGIPAAPSAGGASAH